MTNSEIVIKWAFERVFNGSVKLTKAIHSSLKATILVLAGVEVSLSGPMHSKTKQVLLRDKIFEQSKAFISTQMIANGIPVLPYVTTNLLKSANIFEKTEWKISRCDPSAPLPTSFTRASHRGRILFLRYFTSS